MAGMKPESGFCGHIGQGNTFPGLNAGFAERSAIRLTEGNLAALQITKFVISAIVVM
jgi:hypothetical protein